MRYAIPVSYTDDSTEITWIIDMIEDEDEFIFFYLWGYIFSYSHEEYSRVIARECRDTRELIVCDDLIWELVYSLSCESLREISLHNLEIRIQELTHTLASFHEKNPLLESSRLVMERTNICDFVFG
jgi:hypothetical protein